MAKRLCDMLLEADDTLTPEARSIYERYPMWKFYLCHGTPKRVFGIACTDPDDTRLATITAMSWMNNYTLGGTPAEEMQALDRWPDEIVGNLQLPLYNSAGIFLDPLGFLLPLRDNAS